METTRAVIHYVESINHMNYELLVALDEQSMVRMKSLNLHHYDLHGSLTPITVKVTDIDPYSAMFCWKTLDPDIHADVL